ncbi:GDP-D-glucose phosphorylase 1 [Drosophila pseudoobscura]|uniref:GDP-D-glucose phosphorylase 1 n=1 Tax=Drosophila pseudoobscura pseudoobscura TaxID=46245 RepID=Q29EF0_DROPS|nr:GDP-D-glucose phosphorylase 1 [Drosophila pseudoobscura]
MYARTFRKLTQYYCDAWKLLSARFKQATATELVQRRNSWKSLVTLPVFVVARSVAWKVAMASEEKPKKKRTQSKEKYVTTLEAKAPHYLNSLKVRWEQLHEIPGLFAYQLEKTRQSRVLPGKYQFYTELNPDRTLKRRIPQTIENLNPTFKPKQFNFNKVDALEVMMTIDDVDNTDVQMIINRSPLTRFHTVVCPDVKNNLVQRITAHSLKFCISFMRGLDDSDIRMGYNSPGALASVNHLHFHLLYLPRDLYINNVELQELAGGYVYRLSQSMPTEAICVVFEANDDEAEVQEKVNNLQKLANWMCGQNIPHNLFITQDRRPGKRGSVQVFVFARSHYCVNKDLADFNVGFCELAGYIPVGNSEKLDNLTEPLVIKRIREVTGTAPQALYTRMKQIVDGEDQSIWDQPLTL